ncbi:MAG: 2-oxoacid:acceptor oxidoreductase family protein [Micrococcales bacterium]|nr:2-oxoacid:acceptor oxidoreductase family protein [Micrococcales bacterium]
MTQPVPFPGVPSVINGNGAVAYVMQHVCGGVIGYPITPSTEISEAFEAARAEGQLNVWGRHPFFVETEGEHSAQSGALGAALTGGAFISNASSSQGILYALESHYVTAGKKIGGFVLQVAARVVSKHALNVMAGHDDVYSLLPAGYTILFGSDPQEAADLAAISYKVSALSLVPVANAMDGFATSHVMSEMVLPEPELLRTYLGDPAGRIACPTVAQEILFGARGRVFQLGQYVARHAAELIETDRAALTEYLTGNADQIEADATGDLVDSTLAWLPDDLHASWRRAWTNAWTQGTRQLVPALVDPNNPGLTGPVQNQPDFQAGAADHRTHFASAVPGIVRAAMAEYAELTGRAYAPVQTYDTADADVVVVGMGSITDDLRAVLPYLRAQGIKVGVASVKLLQPFGEAELVQAVANARSVLVMERSDDTALTRLVTQALFRAGANATGEQFAGIPALVTQPRLSTVIFGLGSHDVQPRHLVAAVKAASTHDAPPLFYLGSQFFDDAATGEAKALQDRLRAAYPETAAMALATEPNPQLLPEGSLRIRFHSVGGYGTVATGKLLTDILSGALDLHSKSAPKYGSEKSGAATNYYITLSPEHVLLTNNDLEDVEVVVSPDHMVFAHTNPLKGLVTGGTFILQSSLGPLETWKSLPAYARRTIRERRIKLAVLDAFTVAKKHAPSAELETRMMGIAFIGAVTGHVERVAAGASATELREKVRAQIVKKFGRKGAAVVDGNMAVIDDGAIATHVIDYDAPEFVAADDEKPAARVSGALSAAMCPTAATPRPQAIFDPGYYEDLVARPFREGTIGESPVLPGAGLFMPVGTAQAKNKGIFRREVPVFDPSGCTGCLECGIVCPDAAIPMTVHEVDDVFTAAVEAAQLPAASAQAVGRVVHAWAERTRRLLREAPTDATLTEIATQAADVIAESDKAARKAVPAVVAALAAFPVARTRPFFDAPEKEEPGTGALFSAVVDPWKCTGCLQCIDVCGPNTLVKAEQDADVLGILEAKFERYTQLPTSPRRVTEDAVAPGGDVKRLLLDRTAYYAMVGGHGACRGCGEVTSIRLLTALSRVRAGVRTKAQIRQLEGLLDQLRAKLGTLTGTTDTARVDRITRAIAELDKAVYNAEAGPTGDGPSPTIIANSTGCSSVYASTLPFNPYIDPWVNSLFQDAQPLAQGMFEGIAAQAAQTVKALRTARLELDDAYDAARDDKALAMLDWRGFTDDELAMLPVFLTVSGDGAAYDIGFGAMSRVLAGGTPVKMLVLDTGAYSNTGGQASTASFVGQDSDLSRIGSAHGGKAEMRKELGLIAAFHPNVFSCSVSTALYAHFLETSQALLGYDGGAALMQVYTPCQPENGVADDLSAKHARLAVESRMAPLYVHDPRGGQAQSDRWSLAGNPDVDQLWTTATVQHVDASGNLQLLETPLTPAEFALGEVRFKKHFRKLKPEQEDAAVPVAEYVELAPGDREGQVPFVYATDDDRRLIKVACDGSIIALVEDRRRHWTTLQYLAGVTVGALSASHAAELATLRTQLDEALEARESSMDEIAAALAELATSTAPLAPTMLGMPGPAPAAAPAAAAAAPGMDDWPIWLDLDDIAACNDCGTCYQELPALFEKTTMIVDGQAQVVAQMKGGALDGLEITPEIAARIARVKATCDAEIIR